MQPKRRQTLLTAALALGLAPAAAADSDFVAADALRGAGLVKHWQGQVPLDPGQTVVDAYRVDENLYVCTDDGYVFAVHANTGVIRWLRQVTTGGYRLRKPCHAGEEVIFITTASLRAYDRLTGEPLAEGDLRFPAGSGPATDGARLFLGGINERFYAFAIRDMSEIWKVAVGGPIVSTPVVWGAYLYVASEDGGVYACTTANKLAHWQTTTNAANTADLVADDNGVYVASRDHALYLYDAIDGSTKWRALLSGPLREPPAPTKEVAYQYCPDDGVAAIETALGKDEERIRWKLARGRALLTVDKTTAFIATRDGFVVPVAIADGKEGAAIDASAFTIPITWTADATILLVAPNGRMFSARPKDAPPVKIEDIRKALRTSESSAAGGAAPTTQPAPAAPTGGSTAPLGPPVGGKSKVSREFSGAKP
ncbi:MAG: PQQ-binding-like beta-propeller repeat protein [Phycisphaerae bacterium]